MKLTNAQWQAVERCLPEKEKRPPGKSGGRPFRSAREVLDGVLWILRTGAPWADMPSRYPPYQTCHRRFQQWVKSGVLPRILATLRRDLEKRGGVEDIEGFIDGTYVPAKKGDPASENVEPEMRRRSWRLQTVMVFHSLSLLQKETDTIPFSPTELSTLLSWKSYRLD